MKNTSQTDWERVNKLSDDEIDFTEIPETKDDFWQDAEWYLPPRQDSLIDVLKRYNLKPQDIKMLVKLVERLAL